MKLDVLRIGGTHHIKHKADNLSDKYVLKAVTRGNCMLCGKELTEGIFFCKECEDKASRKSEE